MIEYLPIPPRVKDLTGKQYGSLTVLGFAGMHQFGRQRVSKWWCKCHCGVIKSILATSLHTGRSITCGCRDKQRGQSSLRHLYPQEYAAFLSMWDRCRNPKNRKFYLYGGRGISVTPIWQSFNRFITDIGPRPGRGYSVDRFPNPDGNYEPGNVRWATSREQTRNMRRNQMFTYNGRTLCLSDWAKKLHMTPSSLKKRMKKKWPIDNVFSPRRFPPWTGHSIPNIKKMTKIRSNKLSTPLG